MSEGLGSCWQSALARKKRFPRESERGSGATGCLKIPITSLKVDVFLGQIISVGECKSPGLFWAYL